MDALRDTPSQVLPCASDYLTTTSSTQPTNDNNPHDSHNGQDPTQQKDPLQLAEQALDDSIDSLITHWSTCISELSRLQQFSESSARKIPIRGLNSLLRVQQRALDKVIQKQKQAQQLPDDGGAGPGKAISAAQYYGMRSCCWEDKWSVLKKCSALVSINKDFARSPRLPVPDGEGWLAYKDQPFQEKPVTVDAVVDSGATWLKFLSISPKSLAYQVATEGWDSDDGLSGDDSDGEEKGTERESGLGHTEFAESIRKIVLACRWNHCHHLHLLLPSLREGESEVVDRMLKYIRTTLGGTDVKITISCAGSPFLSGTSPPPPPLEEALHNLVEKRDPLVGDDCGRISFPRVNLDPSALTALVTDLHHGPVPLQPEAQQRIIVQSVQDHETDNNELVSRQDILSQVLYPALRGRKLVCTEFAARYFRQLIGAISTSSEEVRASLVLPSSESTNMTSEERRRELQKWSNVPIPDDLNLPVEIVPDVTLDAVPGLVAENKLPPIAEGVARDLSRLNRSVYLYGWKEDITTITGHRGIERQIQLSLARHFYEAVTTRLDERNERPPDVWHRHLGGYLIHRDKPKDWRGMLVPVPPADSQGGDDAGQEARKEGVRISPKDVVGESVEGLIPKVEGVLLGEIQEAEVEVEVEVPEEIIRWTNPWTTWGRGISTYGLPDTKTWEGVGHEEKQSYGRRMSRREKKEEEEGGLVDGDGEEDDREGGNEEEEQEQS